MHSAAGETNQPEQKNNCAFGVGGVVYVIVFLWILINERRLLSVARYGT